MDTKPTICYSGIVGLSVLTLTTDSWEISSFAVLVTEAGSDEFSLPQRQDERDIQHIRFFINRESIVHPYPVMESHLIGPGA